MIGPSTIQATRQAPVRLGSPPRMIRGADIRATHTYRRPDSQGAGWVTTLEVVLEGGDVVLLDGAAWEFLADLHGLLKPAGDRPGWKLL